MFADSTMMSIIYRFGKLHLNFKFVNMQISSFQKKQVLRLATRGPNMEFLCMWFLFTRFHHSTFFSVTQTKSDIIKRAFGFKMCIFSLMENLYFFPEIQKNASSRLVPVCMRELTNFKVESELQADIGLSPSGNFLWHIK